MIMLTILKTREKSFRTLNTAVKLPLAKLNHRLENVTSGWNQGALTAPLPSELLWDIRLPWRPFRLHSQIPFLPYTKLIAAVTQTGKLAKCIPSFLARVRSVRLGNGILG